MRGFNLAFAGLLLLACLAFFGWRARHGMRYPGLGDETLHYLGARIIQSGGVLYGNFVDIHGPLAYALPHVYGVLFGWREPLNARVILLLLMGAASVAVACSACLRGAWERTVAAAVFIGLTTTLWLVQSLCVNDYQPVAGFLFLIALALCGIPSWFGEAPGAGALFVSGFCLALTDFLSFTFGPASLLFFISAAWMMVADRRWRAVCTLVLGVVAGCASMLLWMAFHADFRGYIAFHFLYGIVDFRPYVEAGFIPALAALWYSVLPRNLAQMMAVVAMLFSLTMLVHRHGRRTWRFVPVMLGLAGVIMTNPRGSFTLQNGSFIIVAFSMAGLALAQVPRRLATLQGPAGRIAWIGVCALVIAAAEMTARRATSSPQDFTRAQLRDMPPSSLAPSDMPWARKVRVVTGPDERILAVPYNPDVYALAGRLPMERYAYWLPWDAEYARHPWLGISHDLCTDLVKTPPIVIYYTDFAVWGRWYPHRYAACLTPILAALYRPMPGETDLFVRRDRVALLAP